MCESSSSKLHEMHSKKGFERIFKMMKMEKFCDIHVVIGSKSYPVHSVVMAAYSDYFHDFNLNFADPFQNQIEINGIDHDVMNKIITFCYTGEIDINKDMLGKIYKAAEILKMKSLLEICENSLKTVIDINNCFLVAEFGSANLKRLAKEFIEFNFNEVCLMEAFLNIEFNLLLDILKSDNLNVSSETTVFSSVKRWAQYDYPKRKDSLHSLYEFIKLPLLPIEMLFDELVPLHSGKCALIVSEAVQWKTISNRKTQFDSSRNVPRKYAAVALSIGDFYLGTSQMVMLYDPQTNSMTEFMDLKTETRNFSAVVLGDEIVIMAGFINLSQNINEVYSYNIKTGKKNLLPPMLETRGHPIVAVIDRFIYAFGGYNGTTDLNTVERFDPNTQKWAFATPMMTARRDASGVIIGNVFYAIGGMNSSLPLNIVESYCKTTEKWKKLTSMVEARNSPAVVAAGGFIYALGGWKGKCLSTMERYDPKTDTWIMVASMSIARFGLGVCVFGEKLLAYGGSDGAKTIANLEEYDPATNKWRTLPSTVSRGHFNFIAVSKGWLKRLKPDAILN